MSTTQTVSHCACGGFAEEASQEKERLEEKQRASRKRRAKHEEEWSTRLVELSLAFHALALSRLVLPYHAKRILIVMKFAVLLVKAEP